MHPIISKIHNSLLKRHRTVAVAESCTGGLVSALLTQFSGSSKYFFLGVVAYSNEAKEALLKIPAHLIARKGAVSPEVAIKMAEGIKKIAKSDFGIGVTGIAGPRGETSRKPVGTVFIAINSKNKKICKKLYFTGSRLCIRKKAALASLQLLKLLMTNDKIQNSK